MNDLTTAGNTSCSSKDGRRVRVTQEITGVIAWRNERQRPELLILEQRSLPDGSVEALGDEDFGINDDDNSKFPLKVYRRGTGLETS